LQSHCFALGCGPSATLSLAADAAEAGLAAVAEVAAAVVVACAAEAAHRSAEVEVHVPAAGTAVHDLAVAMPDALRRCRGRAAAAAHRFKCPAVDDNRSVDCQRRALARARVPVADRSRGPVVAPDLAAEILRVDPAHVPVEAADLAAVSSLVVAGRRSAISITS
jgi:hypothetical protein